MEARWVNGDSSKWGVENGLTARRRRNLLVDQMAWLSLPEQRIVSSHSTHVRSLINTDGTGWNTKSQKSFSDTSTK